MDISKMLGSIDWDLSTPAVDETAGEISELKMDLIPLGGSRERY